MRRDLDALLAFLEARAAMPFAWGRSRNDCVSFAAQAVRVQTGRSLASLIGRHRWSTALGAARVLKRRGGIEAALDRALAPVAPAQAMRGDVAGAPDDRLGLRLMIVEGTTLVGPGENGLVREPRAAMVKAWSAVARP